MDLLQIATTKDSYRGGRELHSELTMRRVISNYWTGYMYPALSLCIVLNLGSYIYAESPSPENGNTSTGEAYRETIQGKEEGLKWRVIFRGVGMKFTPFEKDAGFSRTRSKKFYVQHIKGELIRINLRRLDRDAKDAGIDVSPKYLPEGIWAFVIDNDAEGAKQLPLLKDGDKITVCGTSTKAKYSSASNLTSLEWYVYIAEDIQKGWDNSADNPT